MQSIGSNTFKDCTALSNIVLPASLTSIGEQAFSHCNNLNISVSENNPNYSAENNILYNKDKTKIVAAFNIVEDISIPTTVTEILPYAFEGNSNVHTVYFAQSPTIGQYAFANCINLDSVYFDSYEVPTLGLSSFAGNRFVLYTPYISQEVYQNAFATYTNNISSIAKQVMTKGKKFGRKLRNMFIQVGSVWKI